MQVSTRSPTDQRITDAVRVAPYLTHVIRQHGQPALMPQDNSTHSRKPKREKRPKQERQQRTHEEPHFNVGAPRTPRRGQPGSPGGRPRASRRPDVSDAGSIPDYPPPSFDEAVAAAAADRNASPVSPAESTTTNSSSPDRYQPAPILIPPLPRNQPVLTRTLPDSSELSESVRYSTQAECDSDSDDGDLEVITTSEATSPTTSSEDSPRHPTHGGTRLGYRTAQASGDTVRPSPSQLTLTPHLNGTSQDGGDDQSVSSPSTDSQAGDLLVGARNSTPSPVPPKRRLHLLSGLLKSRDNHTTSVPSTPTYAGASQLSLPLHFLNHPGSPSKPHRGESHIARKLFGHKGKERSIDPDPERPSEPLETWDMLSDVEREVPPASSVPEQFPGSPGPSEPGMRLLSPVPRREGTRLKHRSLLSHRVKPPSLPLASTAQRYPANSTMDEDPRKPVVLVPAQQQSLPPAASGTSSAPPAVLIPPSPSERLPIQSMHALLKPPATVDGPTRGRSLRATSSMVWASGRRISPLPSPTRTVTAPTSPSTTSILSSVANANVDHDADTPTTTVARDDQEGIHGTVPPSPVQEEEEERFVTPPGSPIRSLTALPLATRSRHPSPVRHEGRSGVTLRDDGPVPLGSPTRSDPHSRAARTPIITPRPSIGALHAFAPSNPSPLSNQSFERQAVISPPSTTSPIIEDMAAPRRDTVVSIGDTESLIELYVHSPGPITTIQAASSVTHATASSTSDTDQCVPANGADPKQYHYPGRPLPHPPGASHSGPVRPVLLDMFFAGNVPAGLPPYTEVEPGKQRSASALSSQSQPKQIPCVICVPPSPLVSQPGGYIPPPIPPPGLLAVLDDDVVSEPSSPGSTYEMPSSHPVPPAIQREFTSLEALETLRDDYIGDGDGNMTVTTAGSNRENILLVQSIRSPTRQGSIARMTAPTAGTGTGTMPVAGTQYSVNGTQPGHVQVVRRRVTRSGRVKLKLVLLGTTVDRCVVCKMQFRDHDNAALGTRCRHAFHERCVGSSLSRGNRMCPMCGTSSD